MTDVAQILGVAYNKSNSAPTSKHKTRVEIPAELPTTVPSFIKIGNKQINPHKPARKWTWAPFTSSSRPDGLVLNHWVRANVEYPDYPYARFDIHLDPVQYTPEEYKAWLTSQDWSQSETDALMECARTYELRWPVIHDRWCAICPPRPVEDLQHRFYTVAAKLLQRRISHEAAVETNALEATASDDPRLLLETAAARSLASSDAQHQPLMQHLGTGTSNKVFDLEYEKERRAYWEALWKRTREEEAEEAALRNELKQVEAQLRKLKKRGAHVVAATGSISVASRAATPVPAPEVAVQQVDQAMAATTPVPVPGVPYLQSARLALPVTGGDTGISKALVSRMEALLTEMNVPSTTIATKRACDLMDTVRRDALTWLLLQKQVIQREGILRARRLKLAKMGGNIRVVDEETLLGISPPPARPKPVAKAPTAPAAAAAAKSKAPPNKAAAGSKPAPKKPTTATATGAATTTSTSTTTTDAKPRKPSVKRKRKPDGASAAPNATPSSSETPSSSSNKPKKKPKTADNPPAPTTSSSTVKAPPAPAAIPDKGQEVQK